MNTIFLLNDHSCVMESSKLSFKKLFHSIEYMLVQTNDDIDSFIMIKPNDLLKNFVKAKITYESVIVQYSTILEDFGEKYTPLPSINKEITSIYGLIQLLHSLNRIKYCNKLFKSNESCIYDITEFTSFNIEVFGLHDKIIYKKHMDLTSEKGKFGVNEIIKKIKKLYSIPNIKDGDYLYIDNELNWYYNNQPRDYQMCGVILPMTNSVSFFNNNYIKILNNIHSFYSYTITTDSSIYSDDKVQSIRNEFLNNPAAVPDTSGNVRFFDIWFHEIPNIIEFITYIKYIYVNLEFVVNLSDCGESNSFTVFEIEYYTYDNRKTISLECKKENPISMYDIIEILEKY